MTEGRDGGSTSGQSAGGRSGGGTDHAHLLARAAAGDSDAFHLFYRDTVEYIYRYVSGRVRTQEVEDLVADTFVRAFRSAGQFQDRGTPAIAWLVTIARNVVASHHRSRSRQRLGPTGDARLEPTVEEVVHNRDEEATLITALARLKPSHRRVLTLRFIDDRPVAECADQLNLSEEAVRALTYRALRALRQSLGSPMGAVADG